MVLYHRCFITFDIKPYTINTPVYIIYQYTRIYSRLVYNQKVYYIYAKKS